MKIIYNSLIPFRGYKAMMLFGVIFARKKFKPLSAVTVNHESIHAAQAKDCHGYFPYTADISGNGYATATRGILSK